MLWRKWPPWQTRIQEQAEKERIERERQGHQEVTSALDAVSNELNAGRKQQSAAEAGKKSREIWTIVGLFVTAGAALVALGVSVYQTVLTRGAIQDAESAASQQHTDTVKALSKAQKANALIQKQSGLIQTQMQLGERAWLSVIVSSDTPVVGKAMVVRVITINTGKTYALDVSDCTGYVPDYGPPYFVSFTHPAFGKCTGMKQANLIAPNAYWTQDAYSPAGVNQTQINRFADGEIVLWYFGKVTYRDIFGCWHWVKFCYARQVPSAAEGPLWRNCPNHNETDNANICQKQR